MTGRQCSARSDQKAIGARAAPETARSLRLKDPHHDAAAADVLAAFEAAQGGGLPTVECYHAAVGAWRRAHPDHTATYAAQQAVRIVLDIKTSLRIEEV